MKNTVEKDMISFRRLEEQDIDKIWSWLHNERVRRFWFSGKEEKTFDEVQKQYTKCITGEEPTHSYIMQWDGKDIGYIQTYYMTDYPEGNSELGIDEHAAGVDLFIGEPDFQGKGFGPLFLEAFVNEIVFKMSGITSCIADPAANNPASVRAFEKAGFVEWKRIGKPPEEHVLVRKKK